MLLPGKKKNTSFMLDDKGKYLIVMTSKILQKGKGFVGPVRKTPSIAISIVLRGRNIGRRFEV